MIHREDMTPTERRDRDEKVRALLDKMSEDLRRRSRESRAEVERLSRRRWWVDVAPMAFLFTLSVLLGVLLGTGSATANALHAAQDHGGVTRDGDVWTWPDGTEFEVLWGGRIGAAR